MNVDDNSQLLTLNVLAETLPNNQTIVVATQTSKIERNKPHPLATAKIIRTAATRKM